MYVLVIPSWYFDAGSESIAGRNFHALALALREQNVDARIFFAHLSMTDPVKMHTTYETEDGVPTYRVRQWFPPKVHKYIIHQWVDKYASLLANYILEYGEPDLIHAQSYQAAMVAEVIKIKTGIPYVYTEHLSDFLHDRIPAAYRFAIKKGITYADRMSAVSPMLREQLLSYVTGNIEVIPNFYNSNVFQFGKREKYKSFTWVSVGEPAFVKGYDLLLEAFGKMVQQMPEVEMQLILIDDIIERPDLIKIAEKYKVEHVIFWKGLLTQQEIADIFQHSHVYVSSSRFETFGTAMVEAQACGLPIVATRTAGAEYILQSDEQGIMTETESIEGLQQAMYTMYHQYQQYNPERISKLIFERFNRDLVTTQWISLYKEVMA